MSHNTFTPIVIDGLIFYVDSFNQKSYVGGTSSYDIKNLQIGELVNGVGYNGTFIFDGVDDYINFGSNGVASSLRGATAFSLDIWMKKTSGSNDFVLGAQDQSITTGWFLQWFSDDTIYCGVRNSGSINYTPFVWMDEWVNITMIYDGLQSLDTDKLYLYTNGIPMIMSNTGTILGSVPTDVVDLLIGDLVNYGSPAGGNMSSIIIYNKVLSYEEVLRNHNALKNRFK